VMMTSSRTGSSLADRLTILPTNRLLGQRGEVREWRGGMSEWRES
jgi:hypothetical protein